MSQVPAAADDLPVVLVIDDAEDIRKLVASILGKECLIRTASDGNEGVKAALTSPRPDLILLDVEMGATNGFDTCKALKANPASAAIPVLFLTSRQEEDFESRGFSVGAVDYIGKPINTVLLRARVRTQLALADNRQRLEQRVRERTTQLERARLQVIRRLALAMEYHESSASSNRGVRVGVYAKLIAEAAGGRPALVDLISKAAPLYDIGKIGVPAEVLRKAGKLSAPDWEQMRRYPALGAEMIGEHTDPVMQIARTIALTHQERWNGSGYPKGLKGEEIPWPGRVMGLVSAFEALTTTQFYHAPFSVEDAAKRIISESGTKYDPKIVDAFKASLAAMHKIRRAVTDKLGERVKIDLDEDEAVGRVAQAPVAAAKPAAGAPAGAAAGKPVQKPAPAPAAAPPKRPA